jgi:hypothetical protein
MKLVIPMLQYLTICWPSWQSFQRQFVVATEALGYHWILDWTFCIEQRHPCRHTFLFDMKYECEIMKHKIRVGCRQDEIFLHQFLLLEE